MLHAVVATTLPLAFPLLRAAAEAREREVTALAAGEDAAGTRPPLGDDPRPLQFATAGVPVGSFGRVSIPFTQVGKM